jgi:iron complex outermembrane receptor protein
VTAQQPRVAELADLTLEQLVEVQLVSAVSKRAQKPSEAPSVVNVVSGDEIRRHGYRTLGDVLRTLPSFYVTYDRNYSYVGVRGFGRPGDYNTRILLLIDGSRTNDNIYDGAYVAQEFPLDADLIERIEVSRGPGASIYGNSAFFAVINVVTRRGGDQDGAELRAGAGSFGSYQARASYGRKLRGGAGFIASLSASESDGQTLSFPEFADSQAGTVAGGDRERTRRAFASFDEGGFSLQALHAERRKGIPTASFGTVFGDTRAQTRDAWSLATAAYERSLTKRLELRARISFGSYDYEGAYPFDLGAGDVSLYEDYARGRWWNAESSGTLRAGRHTLLFGVEGQRDSRQDQGGGYAGSPPDLEIADRGARYGLFAQDDVELGSRLRASFGGRYDRYKAFGGEFHPRLGVIFAPDKRTTLKLLYGSAFRAPNEYEQHYYARRQGPLEPESIRTFEAVVERSLGPSLRLTGSAFASDIRRLLTLDSDADGGLFFRNAGGIDSRGGELALDARFKHGTAGRLSYSLQRSRDEAGLPISNSPTHMLKASLAVPVLSQRAWASFDAQYLSARRTLSGGLAGGFVLVDASLFFRKLPGGLEASASVYNVLGARYADPGSEEHRQDTIRQDGRSFGLRVGWRF